MFACSVLRQVLISQQIAAIHRRRQPVSVTDLPVSPRSIPSGHGTNATGGGTPRQGEQILAVRFPFKADLNICFKPISVLLSNSTAKTLGNA